MQPQFSTKSAEVIAAAIKTKVVKIDPLAENYLANLQRISTEIYKAGE